VGRKLRRHVLVPFPVESALSGVRRHHERMWYRRTFEVPDDWRGGGQRLLLHFGAVDHEARVWVNGQPVGGHAGGYDAFSLDVTDALAPAGEQELVVGAADPTDAGGQPLGKQRRHPGGIWYTAASGIWQTVWLEPVPAVRIAGLRLASDVAAGALRVAADVAGPSPPGAVLDVEVLAEGGPVASAQGVSARELRVPVPAPRLWSPDDPFLYGLRVRLRDGDRALDAVESYAGMRSIEVGEVGGHRRILLNGRSVFCLGPLDQGYWPYGNLTAPSDEALRFDLEQARALGFNTVRKHVKVEPERWYWWADRLGVLVWQDMPSPPAGVEPGHEDRERFLTELRRLVEGRRNHPSVVAWVVFNEGWGQFEPERVAALVRSWDADRLVDASSGYNLPGVGGEGGDLLDDHTYVGPGRPVAAPGDPRVAVDGEFGGLGLHLPGYGWSGAGGFAYEMLPDQAALTDRYVDLIGRLAELRARSGLSAAIYTQLTDVEDELNGLLTYDRQLLKVDPERVRRANEAAIAAPDHAIG
jgi:beta-galactosidase/beta-glucuronidase